MKNKGYTLFELMVVVAIIMGLSGVGGISLSKYYERRDRAEITEKLHMYFETMAMEAYTSE